MFFLQNGMLNRFAMNLVSVLEPPKIKAGVFISIPKNGTYSVKKVLKLDKNADRKYGSIIISEKHQKGSVLDDKYDLDHPFVFCFSRDPYDRTISWYEYHKQKKIEPYTSLSFNDWVKAGLPHHWETLKETNWAEEDISPLLQYNFIADCDVDFIGKIEHFQRDMKKIVQKLNEMLINTGREPVFEFVDVKRNKSNRSKDLEHYYTQEAREIVAGKLHRDFEVFGYEK